VYLGHLLANQQTSWVGTILVVFTSLVTVGVAAYLYHSFREYKRLHGRDEIQYSLEGGETEFEIAPGSATARRKSAERLVTRTSEDDFFFDEEEEIGGRS
jgi:hypothetical protein